ncbi:MAG: glycosyl hydrolase 115 family protein [Bryobacteraceae bacterium]|nr:glycosyl hydrolase 115 family protein [Bryobacteraceae bacterium]
MVRARRPAILAAAAVLWVSAAARAEFVLASKDSAAAIVVPPSEPEFLRLAALDLIEDVRRITGRTLPRAVAVEACRPHCVVLASVSLADSRRIIAGLAPGLQLPQEPESARLLTLERPARNILLIAGADPRGTMFALYDLIARELGVDPLYFWSGRSHPRREQLALTVDRTLAAPSFRYRGWFINDEDLLTEWKDGGGPRDINYPYYHQVTAPEIHPRIFEAMLRLKMNLVIPASFNDIDNPAEERMIREAARRGLYVSMHHVEPMGVSAFAFNNYWRARGRSVEYSYASNKAAFEEVWRFYARRWAQYPVVWQVGLRGIADRPIWLADKQAPTTDEGRGAMISDAIALQRRIIAETDPRPQPPITTTLWMEGAYLFRQGNLKLPNDVTIVFADNSPGWKWQADFHDTPREKDRTYGGYYHHAVWGWGPHLVQAVPPSVTFRMTREAYERNGPHYFIANVANIREFVLGLAATAEMVWDIAAFQPDAFLRRWCQERFAAAAEQAEKAYRAFFDAYVLNETRGTPDLLDGLTLHEGNRIAKALLEGRNEDLYTKLSRQDANLAKSFPDLRATGEEPPDALLLRVRRQLAALDRAIAAAEAVSLEGEAADFFQANLVGQAKILSGLGRWTAALAEASIAERKHDTGAVHRHLKAALESWDEIRAGQALNTKGEWSHWYRGDRKMNLGAAYRTTKTLITRKAGS